MPNVETRTPANTPKPIGPYSHIAKVGTSIAIGGVAGIAPDTGELASMEIAGQTRQVLANLEALLTSVNSDLRHVIHVNVFLLHIKDFEEMNRVYAECMGGHLPARTVIGVNGLPKAGALLTMNLTAVSKDLEERRLAAERLWSLAKSSLTRALVLCEPFRHCS